MENFFEILEEELKKDNRLVDENGKILKSKVYDLAIVNDENLLKILLNNKETKKLFFKNVNNIMVFDSRKFGWTITSKSFLPNSYTRYKNKIGLLDSRMNDLLNGQEICLTWPYKDCILEGGQVKDDQKRNEIFYNELLAPDEVSRLLYPKIFTNSKKYSENGIEDVTEIDDNDNLIIKGNNLIVLSSLMKRYEEQIKLIFIDVPYNTGNDSFKYNDSFNHSTWLTFMKNRLDIAKKLLKPEGTIAVYIDSNEIGYLQILMDEVFGRENRGGIISIKRGSVTGHKAINPGVVNITEYILIYANNKSKWKPNKVYRARERNERYNNFIKHRNEEPEKWEFCSLLDAFAEYKGIKKNSIKKEMGATFEKEIMEFVINNADSVIQFAYPDVDKVSAETKELIKKSKNNKDKIYIQRRENELDIVLKGGQRLLFYKDRLMYIDGKLTTAELVSDFWDDVLPNDLHSEGNIVFKKGKKPEKAIKRVIDLFTQPNDIVLDFFMGSGSTVAVAHKMKRQYIGVEQMDYIGDTAVKRLNDVINNNDKKGVTKITDWKGGGSFIYCELKELNEKYIYQIQNIENEKDLLQLYEQIIKTGFISENVNISQMDINDEEFKQLELNDKKKLIIEILNKNMLYVNLCDIDDVDFEVTENEKKFTNSFYRRK